MQYQAVRPRNRTILLTQLEFTLVCARDAHSCDGQVGIVWNPGQPAQGNGLAVEEQVTLHRNSLTENRLIEEKVMASEPLQKRFAPGACRTIVAICTSILPQAMIPKIEDMKVRRNIRSKQGIVQQGRLTRGYHRVLVIVNDEHWR